MLKELNKLQIEKAKEQGTCPEAVYSFLEQLTEDFKLIIPPSPDPIKQAENLLNTLFKIAKEDFSAFNQESLDKLLLVYDVYPDQGGEKAYLINEFYQGVNTIKTLGIEAVEKQLISQHMDNIIAALKKNETKAVIQACTEFGVFFQSNFPGKRLDKIQQYLRNFHDYENKELPSLDIIGALLEAKIRVYVQIAAQGNQKDILAMDALSKGIAVFGTLMGGDRVGSVLGSLDITEEAISNAEKLIDTSLPYPSTKLSNATELIEVIEKDCADCELHLHGIILREASKLPGEGSKYYKSEGEGEGKRIIIGEIDVDRLSAELIRKEGNFSNGSYYEQASKELIVAAKSYQTIKKLHETLKSDESDPVKKLENYKCEYDKPETQQALKSNPDSTVVRFFKKAGYYLANFFTAGMVHILTKGSPIMSPQQKLGKRARDVLETAAEQEILDNKRPKK